MMHFVGDNAFQAVMSGLPDTITPKSSWNPLMMLSLSLKRLSSQLSFSEIIAGKTNRKVSFLP